METCLRSLPSRSNFTLPSFRANRVSSLPLPTLTPGWMWVPRWRTLPPKLNEASDSLCQSLLTGLLVYLQAMGEEYPDNLTVLLDDDDEKE